MRPPLTLLLSLAALLLLPAAAQKSLGLEAADRPTPALSSPQNRRITLNFQNEDIGVFIRFVSEITGRNFLVDPRVRGEVTVISSRSISAADVYAVFLSVLDVHGFAVIDTGPVAKILPTAEALSDHVAMPEVLQPEDRLVTRVVPLVYADAGAAKALLLPLASQRGALISVPSANLLVITDTASNLLRLIEIVSAVDVEDEGMRMAVVPLRYADSRAMAATLNALFEGRPQKPGGANSRAIRFFAAERTNALVFRSPATEAAGLEALIATLDEKETRDRGRIQIHRLSFARAEDAVEILRSVVDGTAGAQQSAARILSDAATNSLIVQADPAVNRSLAEVIRRLDAPRAMVYVEALIMEVRSSRELQLGIEWSAAGERSLSGRDAFAGGGFRDRSENRDLPALVGGQLPEGFTLGVFTEPVDIAGVTFNNLAAILKAFQADEDITILSTPQILAIDNEEARINISRNIPFQTSTSTEENETFNSFEYRDVGTVLTLTPHIGQKEQIRIEFDLEVSAVQSTLDFRPITLRRTLNNTLSLYSGHTVVIGGTLEETGSGNQRKVPVLGDAPAAGRLFRIDDDSTSSSRFFVFLTPTIVRNPLQAAVSKPTAAPADVGGDRSLLRP